MSRLSDRLAKIEAQQQQAKPARDPHLIILFEGETEEDAYRYDWHAGAERPIEECLFMTEAEFRPVSMQFYEMVGTDDAAAETDEFIAKLRFDRLERRCKAEGRNPPAGADR